MTSDRPRPRPLAEVLTGLPFGEASRPGPSPMVHRIVADSRLVQPGDLFVAVPGHQQDGHAFTEEAVRRGAVAIVAEQDAREIGHGVPVIRVRDSRRALAELAASWYEHPARRLRLVGITGSFGKSGSLHMLRAILERAGIRAGALGSDFIGLDVPGQPNQPLDHTTPDALELHRALARVADSGAGVCALEVSSQGLVQDRVHGLVFDLGIFTTVVPLEHSEYHETFRSYVEAKELFLPQLRPRAPLLYPVGERVVDALVRGHDVTPVSCGAAGSDATVCYHGLDLRPRQTRLVLEVRRPLPLVEGGTVGPVTLPLELRLPGRGNASNAVLAAVAGLCLGADPEAVRGALADLLPGTRRLELTRVGGFHMLDDTATHPESLNVLFEIVRGIPHRRLHLVTAIRGGRGEELNRRYGEAIGIWARHCPIHGVTATSSGDTVEEADRVGPAERDAFLAELRKAGLTYQLQETLDGAVRAALEQVGEGDLLVLLGAQGMHGGAELVRQRVDGATGPRPRPDAPTRDTGGRPHPPRSQPEVPYRDTAG